MKCKSILLHYLATFCSNNAVSAYLVKNDVLSMLGRQLKEVTHSEVKLFILIHHGGGGGG